MRFKVDWASLIVGSEFTVFALLYFVFEGNFPSISPRGAYIWKGDLTRASDISRKKRQNFARSSGANSRKNRPISREKSQNSQRNRPISRDFSGKKSNFEGFSGANS